MFKLTYNIVPERIRTEIKLYEVRDKFYISIENYANFKEKEVKCLTKLAYNLIDELDD